MDRQATVKTKGDPVLSSVDGSFYADGDDAANMGGDDPGPNPESMGDDPAPMNLNAENELNN